MTAGVGEPKTAGECPDRVIAVEQSLRVLTLPDQLSFLESGVYGPFYRVAQASQIAAVQEKVSPPVGAPLVGSNAS